MPNKPSTRTEDLANTEYDAKRRAQVEGEPGAARGEGETNEPLPITGEAPDVGLSQKGSGEDAVVRRETEI